MLFPEDYPICLGEIHLLWSGSSLLWLLREWPWAGLGFLKEGRPRLVILHQLDPVYGLDESREPFKTKCFLVEGGRAGCLIL